MTLQTDQGTVTINPNDVKGLSLLTRPNKQGLYELGVLTTEMQWLAFNSYEDSCNAHSQLTPTED